MNILIVDSSTHIIERLEEILKEGLTNRNIYRANSFDKANEIYEMNLLDIVLLDMDLPQNKSLKFLFKIKKTNHKTVVIAMYNRMNKFLEEQYERGGADFLVDKYHDFEKIPFIIKKL